MQNFKQTVFTVFTLNQKLLPKKIIKLTGLKLNNFIEHGTQIEQFLKGDFTWTLLA